MQHPSPGISSPSIGFLGPRTSPLFSSYVDQNVDGVVLNNNSGHPRPSIVATALSSQEEDQQAPPKKLARAMEGLSRAHRHIAEVRSGADLLLEALESAVGQRGSGNSDKKASTGVLAATVAAKKALDALRLIGTELENSGILRGAQQRNDDNQPWGLQPPSVCPDGQVTPYAWKRQIAGQAAASAVDRTRLALKSFAEQKKRFFSAVGDDSLPKRIRVPTGGYTEEAGLGDILRRIQSDAPAMAVTPFLRLEWGKRTSSSNLSKVVSDPGQAIASLPLQALNPVKLDPGLSPAQSGGEPVLAGAKPHEKVALLEMTIPGVLRAIVSLKPTGSTYPDAIAVFSPDEFGSYVHAWGISRHNLHQKISENGVNALHYLQRESSSTALERLLHWIYSYRTLFSEPCCECKRMTALDAPSDLLLPPLVRLYNNLRIPKTMGSPARTETSQKEGELGAFHIGCLPPKDLKVY